MSSFHQLESLEDRRLMSVSWLAGQSAPLEAASPTVSVASTQRTTGLWNLIGEYKGTYVDVKNSVGADYDIIFVRQRFGVLQARVAGNGETFTASGTIDPAGQILLKYRAADRTYYIYGQIHKGASKITGQFSIRAAGACISWGNFAVWKLPT